MASTKVTKTGIVRVNMFGHNYCKIWDVSHIFYSVVNQHQQNATGKTYQKKQHKDIKIVGRIKKKLGTFGIIFLYYLFCLVVVQTPVSFQLKPAPLPVLKHPLASLLCQVATTEGAVQGQRVLP